MSDIRILSTLLTLPLLLQWSITSSSAINLQPNRQIVNPHPFQFTINNHKICNVNTNILIWVHSAPNHSRMRNIIRYTWANPVNFRRYNVSLVFFMGQTDNVTIQHLIDYESEVYGDIVQSSYIDSYRNLTYKAISGCKWFTEYCKWPKTIIKADDDMVVDVYLLMQHLERLQDEGKVLNNTFLCAEWKNRKPSRPAGKWQVTKDEYPADTYPTYCPGLGLVMTSDLVSRLYEASLYEPYFWIDDVYTTGLLGKKVNATFESLTSSVHFGDTPSVKQDSAFYSSKTFIFYHLHNYNMKYMLWSMIRARSHGSIHL